MKEENLYKKRIDSIIKELERCSKEDCDFYLEHNEVIEFYEYIKKLMLSEKARKEAMDLIEKLRFEKWAITGTDIIEVMDILDIDKGE